MATAKKPAAKKTAKPAARKTATKKPATKAAATKKTTSKKVEAGQVSKTSSISPLDKLRSINITSAIVGLLFSILVVALVGSASAEVLLGHQARDAFANLDSVVLGSTNEVLVSVEYKYVLVAALLMGAIGSLLIATKLRGAYEAGVKASISGWRWIFMGISAALTLEYVSFIGGVQDVMVLKTVAALIFVTALLGWISQRENADTKDQKWLAYAASLFTGFAAWLPLIGSLVGTSVFGGERFGWHVYALALAVLVGFSGFAINQYSSIKKKSQLQFTVFEQRCLRIDQLTKFLIVLITIAALQK